MRPLSGLLFVGVSVQTDIAARGQWLFQRIVFIDALDVL